MGVAMANRIPAAAAFDYTSYGSAVADQLREAADHIRARGLDQIAAIADIGKALADVKEKVGHGNWGPWLASEFSMSVSTANRYMRGAKFVEDNFADNKFVTETNLTANVLSLISAKSTPPSLAQEVVDRIMANDPISEKEVRRRLHDLKKQKGMVGTALVASNINRKSDRVATQQNSPADRHEVTALVADPLEQVKHLMAKANDPVDIIKALILDLDGATTQRFNTWFLARVEPRGEASTPAEGLHGTMQSAAAGADQPGVAPPLTDAASGCPPGPNGDEGDVVGTVEMTRSPEASQGGPAPAPNSRAHGDASAAEDNMDGAPARYGTDLPLGTDKYVADHAAGVGDGASALGGRSPEAHISAGGSEEPICYGRTGKCRYAPRCVVCAVRRAAA
jgi:hypothetical protein